MAEPLPGAPGGGAEDDVGREAEAVHGEDLGRKDAVQLVAGAVGARVEGHPRLVGAHDRLAAARVEILHGGGVRRELGRRGRGEIGEDLQLGDRGNQCGSLLCHRLDEIRAQPGAVLDAVDPGLDQAGQDLVTETVGGDARVVVVGHLDRLGERLGREGRFQVSLGPVDPVADELDPAVPGAGLPLDGLGQAFGLDLVGVVAHVALRTPDVAAGADQPGQVVTGLDPAGVGGGAGVAQEQGAGVAVGDRLRLGGLLVDGSVRPEPDVAVGIDETGDDPARCTGLRP